MGTKDKMFKWIRSFLTSRKIAGSVGKNLTENLRVDNGTSQGSNISPNLSSVMINGIFWRICSTIGVSLFADDRAGKGAKCTICCRKVTDCDRKV